MKIKLVLLWFFTIVTIIFFYSGYVENKCDYSKKYMITFGWITNNKLETIKINESIKNINNIGIYSTKYKYRIKNFYEYYINDKTYTSYFYNDGNSDNYIEDRNIIKEIYNKYNEKHPIKIYYNKMNNDDNCVNIKKLQTKNSLFYYLCSIISFIASIIILFFSHFFINE